MNFFNHFPAGSIDNTAAQIGAVGAVGNAGNAGAVPRNDVGNVDDELDFILGNDHLEAYDNEEYPNYPNCQNYQSYQNDEHYETSSTVDFMASMDFVEEGATAAEVAEVGDVGEVAEVGAAEEMVCSNDGSQEAAVQFDNLEAVGTIGAVEPMEPMEPLAGAASSNDSNDVDNVSLGSFAACDIPDADIVDPLALGPISPVFDHAATAADNTAESAEITARGPSISAANSATAASDVCDVEFDNAGVAATAAIDAVCPQEELESIQDAIISAVYGIVKDHNEETEQVEDLGEDIADVAVPRDLSALFESHAPNPTIANHPTIGNGSAENDPDFLSHAIMESIESMESDEESSVNLIAEDIESEEISWDAILDDRESHCISPLASPVFPPSQSVSTSLPSTLSTPSRRVPSKVPRIHLDLIEREEDATQCTQFSTPARSGSKGLSNVVTPLGADVETTPTTTPAVKKRGRGRPKKSEKMKGKGKSGKTTTTAKAKKAVKASKSSKSSKHSKHSKVLKSKKSLKSVTKLTKRSKSKTKLAKKAKLSKQKKQALIQGKSSEQVRSEPTISNEYQVKAKPPIKTEDQETQETQATVNEDSILNKDPAKIPTTPHEKAMAAREARRKRSLKRAKGQVVFLLGGDRSVIEEHAILDSDICKTVLNGLKSSSDSLNGPHVPQAKSRSHVPQCIPSVPQWVPRHPHSPRNECHPSFSVRTPFIAPRPPRDYILDQHVQKAQQALLSSFFSFGYSPRNYAADSWTNVFDNLMESCNATMAKEENRQLGSGSGGSESSFSGSGSSGSFDSVSGSSFGPITSLASLLSSTPSRASRASSFGSIVSDEGNERPFLRTVSASSDDLSLPMPTSIGIKRSASDASLEFDFRSCAASVVSNDDEKQVQEALASEVSKAGKASRKRAKTTATAKASKSSKTSKASKASKSTKSTKATKASSGTRSTKTTKASKPSNKEAPSPTSSSSPSTPSTPSTKRLRKNLATHINGVELPTGKDPESRRLRRLMRNRLSAQASRDRKNSSIESYKKEKLEKDGEIAALERELQMEMQRMKVLEQMIHIAKDYLGPDFPKEIPMSKPISCTSGEEETVSSLSLGCSFGSSAPSTPSTLSSPTPPSGMLSPSALAVPFSPVRSMPRAPLVCL